MSKVVNNALRLSKRSYGAAAAQALAKEGLQVSKLNNGAVVASIDTGSALARIAVYFKGGARYNTFPGANSALCTVASGGYSSAQHTGLHLTRSREQTGATLAVTSGREALAYSVASSRDEVTVPLYTLANLTSNDSYRYWELPNPEEIGRLKAMQECSAVDTALDLAVKAAFRAHPLGNPSRVPDYYLGKLSADDLNAFVRATHGQSSMVVVGSGIDHDLLVDSASGLGVATPSAPAPSASAAKYLGGDVRVETGGALAAVVVAGEGAAVGTSDHLAALVAAEVLVPSCGVKYSDGGVSSALVAAANGVGAQVGPVAEFYQDTGLLGLSVVAPAAEAPALVSSLAASLRSLQPSEAAVAAAKRRVEAKLLIEDSAEGFLSSVGKQLLLRGEVTGVEEHVKDVQAVSAAAVAKVLKKAFGGKLTVAATGSVNNVPYSDTL